MRNSDYIALETNLFMVTLKHHCTEVRFSDLAPHWVNDLNRSCSEGVFKAVCVFGGGMDFRFRIISILANLKHQHLNCVAVLPLQGAPVSSLFCQPPS